MRSLLRISILYCFLFSGRIFSEGLMVINLDLITNMSVPSTISHSSYPEITNISPLIYVNSFPSTSGFVIDDFIFEGSPVLTFNNTGLLPGVDCTDDTTVNIRLFWAFVRPGATNMNGNLAMGIGFRDLKGSGNGSIYSGSVRVMTGIVNKSFLEGSYNFSQVMPSPDPDGIYAHVFMTNGPSGTYTISVRPGRSESIYAYNYNVTPEIMSEYVESCPSNPSKSVAVSGINYVPVDPVYPDTTCNFWLDNNTLDLGTVDQKSATGTYASSQIYGQCNADANVNLRASP